MSAEMLRDKIRGGLLGEILGNLNGIPHEMQYIHEPGGVTEYVPALPEGARTDDDTDLEWVYLVAMQRHNAIMLPPSVLTGLWKERINTRIWCSNLYARQLMDIGFEPPLTGSIVFNPWAHFNISGQFVCEAFGLMAPGMPRTAARIGLNYTRITIDAEPAQTTQLFCAMIATAFLTDDLERILDAGVAATDPACTIREIVADVRGWHRRHPRDWRATRRLVKEKYSRHNGEMRDRNGYELNTASTIAALLYGEGDFVPTLITAFNFGWDADNTAATSGTIIGVIKGYRWMMSQGWQIIDRYRNTTRDAMPDDETITSHADRIIDLADRTIGEHGGQRSSRNGSTVYRIAVQEPANVEPISGLAGQQEKLRRERGPSIEATVLQGTGVANLAHAAYAAICLDMAPALRAKSPDRWQAALDALARYPKVTQALYFHAPMPSGDRLREKAKAAGLQKPEKRITMW
jgi:ADP-ribosylglycohydrolase